MPKIRVTQIANQQGGIQLQIAVPNHPIAEVVIQIENLESIKLVNGMEFEGRCTIVQEHKPPLVINGILRQKDGKTIAQHPKMQAKKL